MSIFENALFIIDGGKIYATEYIIVFIWGVYLAVCLVTLLASFLPKIIVLTSRFARWCKNKIQNKKRKEN